MGVDSEETEEETIEEIVEEEVEEELTYYEEEVPAESGSVEEEELL